MEVDVSSSDGGSLQGLPLPADGTPGGPLDEIGIREKGIQEALQYRALINKLFLGPCGFLHLMFPLVDLDFVHVAQKETDDEAAEEHNK